MSEPVVVLNKDHRLHHLSLQCNVSGAQKRLQVCLARDAKLDGLASFTGSRLAPSGRKGSRSRPRKRRALDHALNQNSRLGCGKATISGKIWTSDNACDQGSNEQATLDARCIQTMTNASNLDGNEPAKLGTSIRILNDDGSDRGGSGKLSTLDERSMQPSNDASDQDDSKRLSTLDKRNWRTLANTSEQDNVQAATLDRRSGQSATNSPDRDGSELADLSNRPSYSSNSQHEEISKEDFMALLCLSPTLVAARVRKCNRHRASKYLYIKSRYLWTKICAEGNDSCCFPDTKAVQRPSYVLLERSYFIDRMALQPVPQSIYLKSLKYIPKAAYHRKRLIDLCKSKSHSLNVVLKRDSGLDRLALQAPNVVCSSSSNSPHDTSINHASEKPGGKQPSVKIKRDSGLDMLALQTCSSIYEPPSSNSPGMSIVSSCESKLTSMAPLPTHTAISRVLENPGLKNLSIKINRDPCIDQLAVQNSPTTVNDSGSDCSSTTVPYCQPTSKVPLDCLTSVSPLTTLPGEGRENSLNHNCKSAPRLLPNFNVHNDPELQGPRRAVIKLRRISSDKWSVIQADRQGLELHGPKKGYVALSRDAYDFLIQPQSSSSIGSGYKSDTTESTGSENLIAELTRNPCNSRLARLPSFNSGSSKGDFYRKTRSHDIQSTSSQPHQPTLPRLSSGQSTFKAGPVFSSSARKNFGGVPTTVSFLPCSKSARRTKSVPSTEELPLELHHNENKNPQKHVIPPVKTVNMSGKHSSDEIVKSRVLRKNSITIIENDLLKEPQLARFRDHQNNNDYKFVKPSISCCMLAKKPLGVKSEFYSTFNVNQTAASDSSQAIEQVTVS